MTLKRQMALLILGLILVPLITVSMAFIVIQTLNTTESEMFDLRSDEHAIESWLQNNNSTAELQLNNPMVIMFEQDTVIYKGNGINDYRSLSDFTNDYDVMNTWVEVGQKEYRIVRMFRKGTWNIGDGIPLFALIFPTFIILFISGMSAWIIKTFHSKLKHLIHATQRLGEGDFTTSVSIESKDEFSLLAASLDSMRQQINNASEDRKRLLMGISHDLKTPLAGIKGYVQALRDGLATTEDKRSQYLNIIADKSNLLERRIASLIEFVKLDSSNWQMTRSNENANETINNWFSEFKNDIEVNGRNCRLENSMPNQLPCNFDLEQVRRAIENLVSNSIKHSQPEANVVLSARVKDNAYVFEVSNTGEKLLDGESEKLFDSFYRGDRGRNTEGLGLGLTVVEKVASLHQGKATYHYSDNKHYFTMILPLN